jgi:O-antigen/teichoic acid export membrane protein
LHLDLAIVAAFVGIREAGLYAVGSAAANVVRTQGTAIGIVALPQVAASKDHATRDQAIGLFFRVAILANALTAGAVFIAASTLVPLIYGADFSDAVSIVHLLVLGVVAASLRQVLGDCLRGAGRPLSGSLAEVASWVAAVAGLAVLVPIFGVDGAAAGVSFSYGIALAVLIGLTIRAGVSIRALLLPTKNDLDRVLSILQRRRGSDPMSRDHA